MKKSKILIFAYNNDYWVYVLNVATIITNSVLI